MKPPDPSFADEFNVPQEYTVLVFDVRQAVVSLPFQIRRLEMLVEAGLVAFSSACLEFADEVPEEAQHGSLANLPEIFQPPSRPFKGCCCGVLRVGASSPLLSVARLRSSQPPRPRPAHQPCAPRGCLERGTSSAAVESMASAMPLVMSLMQVPSGIGGSATTIAFATWHRRFGSAINRLRSAVFGVSLVLPLLLRVGSDLRGIRTFAYTRL